MKKLFFTLFLILSLATGAFGETLTIQPSTADVVISQLYPDSVSPPPGLFPYQLFVYADSAESNVYRSLVQFNFTALPDGKTISSAILSLYFLFTDSSYVGRTYWAYELTRTDWVEAQATWNSYKSGSAWTNPGGDYTTSNGASCAARTTPGWMDWDVTAIVQDAQANHGKVANFLLKDGNENWVFPYGFWFPSREYEYDTHPKLVITTPSGYSYIF